MDVHASPPQILIIEADSSTLELYRRALSPDYDVLACTNESQALKILQAQPLSAVVLEPAGLGLCGWDLLANIKSNPHTRAVPVILCSTLDERRKGLEMGAAVFLVKPVLPSTLVRVLHHVTSNQGASVPG